MFSESFAIYRLLMKKKKLKKKKKRKKKQQKKKTGLIDLPEVTSLRFEITEWLILYDLAKLLSFCLFSY